MAKPTKPDTQDNPAQNYLFEESALPENLQEVNRPPIVTGEATGGSPPGVSNFDRYNAGALPSTLGLQTDLAHSQLSGNLPVHRLMPVPASGTPGLNSAAQTQSNLLVHPVKQQTDINTGAIAAATAPPGYVNGVSISKTVAVDNTGTLVQVISVGFTPPAANNNLGAFQTAFVYATGYRGSTTPTLMGSGPSSPILIPLAITQETVTLTVQSDSVTGVFSDFGAAPTATVVLNGTTTPPLPPSINQTLAATTAGYTFSFFYENSGTTNVIAGYNIYRNISNVFAGSTFVKHVPQPSANASGNVTGSYTFLDVAPTGTVYYYFVTSISIQGIESTSQTSAQSGQVLNGTPANLNGKDGVAPSQTGQNLVYNGDFSIATPPSGIQSATASAIRVQDFSTGGSTLFPSCNGWTRNFESISLGEGYIYQLVTPASQGLVGPFCMVMQDTTSGGGDAYACISDAFSVRQNTSYNFSASLNIGYLAGFPAHAEWFFRVFWYKVGSTNFSRPSSDIISFTDIVSASTASGQQSPSATLTSPTDAGYCRIAFYHWHDGTPPSSVWNFVISNVQCNTTLANTVDGPSRFAATASTLTYRPLTNPLTSTDAGGSATVTIAAFTMRTSSKGDVSISGGSITSLSNHSLTYIYYDDPTLTGGAVTYHATATKETAINGTGRFFVGSIVTATSGGSQTTGNNDGGVGASAGSSSVFLCGATTTVVTSNASVSMQNALDGDLSTFGFVKSTATSGAASGQATIQAMSPTSAPWSSLVLNIRSAVPTNPALCTAQLEYSLDGGNSYTTVYNLSAATRALTTDQVTLSISQNLALIKIRTTIGRSSGTAIVELDLYEAWVLGLQ